MLNSATGTPLADTWGANMAAGYTTEEVPTCGDRAERHCHHGHSGSGDPAQGPGRAKALKHGRCLQKRPQMGVAEDGGGERGVGAGNCSSAVTQRRRFNACTHGMRGEKAPGRPYCSLPELKGSF